MMVVNRVDYQPWRRVAPPNSELWMPWDFRATFDANGWYCQAIFDTTENPKHRYMLSRSWGGGKHLTVIGLNPSTATESVLDPTVRRCVGFARDWGYAGLIMLNLFSLRSTDPRALYMAAVKDTADGGDINTRFIDWYCDPECAGMVLAAWGNHGGLRRRGYIVARQVIQQRAPVAVDGVGLHCFGVTKEGHPIHPLYQPRDRQPVPYVVLP